MPQARTHDILTTATAIALVPATYLLLKNADQSLSTACVGALLLPLAHLISGVFFSPDLDIDSAIDNRWGPLAWIWRPYMWAVPHRSRWLSHGLLIPPLLRLLYLILMLGLLFMALGFILGQFDLALPAYDRQTFHTLLALAQRYPLQIGLILAGFITGGAVHSLADWIVSGVKAVLR